MVVPLLCCQIYWIVAEQTRTALVSMSAYCDLLHVPSSLLLGIRHDSRWQLHSSDAVRHSFKLAFYVMWAFCDVVSIFNISIKRATKAPPRIICLLFLVQYYLRGCNSCFLVKIIYLVIVLHIKNVFSVWVPMLLTFCHCTSIRICWTKFRLFISIIVFTSPKILSIKLISFKKTQCYMLLYTLAL